MSLISSKDLIYLSEIGVLFMLAGIVPERRWEKMSRLLARWRVKLHGFSCDHLAPVMEQQLGVSSRDLVD
jgi:hypothetical protein